MRSRVPILLLTGFLGSGKTTLLNRLMQARPESRGKLAIVVNEFGEVGIDGDLLPSDMTRQVELPGGCICCVLNEDLDKTLIELLDSTPDIEHIVIETTGVAEPLPIAWSIDREPLCERVRLAAVVTVVDALEFISSRSLSVAVDAQVEYADILIISKTDLIESPAEVSASGQPPSGQPASDNRPSLGPLHAALETLNPDALRITGTPQEIVTEVWRTVADPTMPEPGALSDTARASGSNHSQPGGDHAGSTIRGHQDAHPSHSHLGQKTAAHEHADGAGHGSRHDFESIALPIENTIDFEELTSHLEELPGTYVRIKGIARAIDESTGSSEPRWIAFHRVGTRVSYEPFDWPLDRPVAMRMVALGRQLDASRLAACLDASVVRSSGDVTGDGEIARASDRLAERPVPSD